MKSIFDDEKLELKCDCGRKVKETIGRLKNNPKIRCTCGVTINVKADELRKALESAQKSLDSITKNFRI